MKVLLINTLYDPNVLGGAEKSVQFLAESLPDADIRPVVLTTNPDGGNKVGEINRVKVYYLDVKNFHPPFLGRKSNPLLLPFWHLIDTCNIRMASVVESIINAEHPDVVHTNNLSGFSVAAWSAAKRTKTPIVHTLRDYYLLCPRTTMFHRNKNCTTHCWHCKIYSFYRKRKSALVEAVVGNSAFILDLHLRNDFFNRARIKSVIFSAYPQPPRTAVRPQRPDNLLRLGFLGRIKANKGIEGLVRAFLEFPAENYELLIGGIDEMGIGSVYKRANIHFLGHVEPEAFFPRIDLLIVPSLWHDPLPRTIFEAYAHGVPVGGAKRGGIPEIIDEGVSGFTFEPQNPTTLIERLEFIRNHPELLKKMRRNASEKHRRFTPQTCSNTYAAVYDRLVGSRTARAFPAG